MLRVFLILLLSLKVETWWFGFEAFDSDSEGWVVGEVIVMVMELEFVLVLVLVLVVVVVVLELDALDREYMERAREFILGTKEIINN